MACKGVIDISRKVDRSIRGSILFPELLSRNDIVRCLLEVNYDYRDLRNLSKDELVACAHRTVVPQSQRHQCQNSRTERSGNCWRKQMESPTEASCDLNISFSESGRPITWQLSNAEKRKLEERDGDGVHRKLIILSLNDRSPYYQEGMGIVGC
ncbi:hypothetical protein D918_06942 [Trichuris suis]|nr:hypothetical protein D918_06942 [Trichuris suis]